MKNLLSIRSYSTKPTSHAHEYHQVVLPLRGVINIEVEGFRGKVGPRECVIVRANETHLFTANKEARFIVADMDALPSNIQQSSNVVFEVNQSLLHFLSFVESQLEAQLNETLEQSMYQMFYLLMAEQSLLPKLDARVSNVLQYIEQHLSDPLTISTLANIAFLSPTQFKKIFKRQMGLSVAQYIGKCRMEKAQALITHTDYPLSLIGEKVGYKELSAFSRKFKQHFGITPTQFKR